MRLSPEAEALQSSDAAAAASSSAAEMQERVQKLALRTVSQPTTLGKDKAWAEMTEAEQEAARELGWIEASWDGGEGTQACSWMWAALPPPQRTAAVTLGYAEAAWNAEYGRQASAGEHAPIAVVVNSNASVGAEVNAFPMATCNMI